MLERLSGSSGLLDFPSGFLWGAATASYRIESGARYSEDVAIMAELGLPAYRFSVSWSRVMPDGKAVSQQGLDHYRRLVDELRGREIEPMLTLCHWDLPQPLADEGGWRSRKLAEDFADYATAVHAALGDRVLRWTTINEPSCSAFLGYGAGSHAPGHVDPAAALVAAHHQLLAHGTALAALRAVARGGQEFSPALNLSPVLADGYGPEHAEAARKFDGLHNRFFLDPLVGKGYPADVLEDVAHVGGLEPAIKNGDLETIAGPLDGLGVNYHAPTRVKPLADPRAPSNCPLPGLRGMAVSLPRGALTSSGGGRGPRSLTELLRWLNWHTGGLPLVVAENGAAFADIAEHLRAVHAAIGAGADVRGYLLWSLLDNLGWTTGYSRRSAVVPVDLGTQHRTLNDSTQFYRDVIALNAVPAGDPDE